MSRAWLRLVALAIQEPQEFLTGVFSQRRPQHRQVVRQTGGRVFSVWCAGFCAAPCRNHSFAGAGVVGSNPMPSALVSCRGS